MRILERVAAVKSVHWFFFIWALSLTVSLSVGFAASFRSSPSILDADELEYYVMAGQILDGSFQVHPRRTLGFPLVLAGIRGMYDNIIFIQVVITLLSSLASPLLFLVTRKLTRSSIVGALAGLAFAFWPSAVFFGTSLYSETVALPAFLMFLYLLPVGSRVSGAHVGSVPALGVAVAAGLMLGLTTHIRTMYLLFVPFAILIFLLEERSFRVAAKRASVFLLAFVSLIAPWSIYMTYQFDRPILVTSNGGETLAGGLNPRLFELDEQQDTVLAKRRAWNGPGKWLPYSETKYLSDSELKLRYDELDGLLRARTLNWIQENPKEAGALQLYKLGYMWGLYPWDRNDWRQTLFGNAPVLAILLITVLGFASSARARLGLARLWVLPVFVSGVALISWGSWRFRQPADAAMLAFCVIVLSWYASRSYRLRQVTSPETT